MKKLKVLSALALSAILAVGLFAGCSGGKNTGEKRKLNVYNWGDYIDEDLIREFEQETGIDVTYDTYDTNETMYTKVKGGSSEYDIVVPSDYMIEKMINEKLVEKIDFNNIPNYKYVGNEFKKLSYDPKDEYSVPYMWGTIGIIYNPEMVKKPVNSWDILWDKDYSGQIIMFDSVRDSMAIGLKKLGYSMNSTNPKEIAAAGKALEEQKPLVQAYMVDEVKDAMISGNAALAPVWSGDAQYIIKENPDLKYVVPKEGTNKWFDGLCIPKGSKHKTEAEEFINFLCKPKNALKNVEYIGYQTPITDAFNMLSDEVKAQYPTQEELKKSVVFKDLNDETLKLYDQAWIKVRS